MQVKELRPAQAFRSSFSSLKAQLLQYRKTRPATSREVKSTQFFNLHKIHHIFDKKNHINNIYELWGEDIVISKVNFDL